MIARPRRKPGQKAMSLRSPVSLSTSTRKPRRMGHQELVGDHAVVLDVNDDPLRQRTSVPPVGHIGLAHGGHIFRPAIDHAEAIHVAAILGLELGDEARLPDRTEALDGIERRQAGITGVHEHRTAVGPGADLVNIDVPGDERLPRHQRQIVLALREHSFGENVLEAPQLYLRREPQSVPVPANSHGAAECLLVHGDGAVRHGARQEQPPALVGREGEACAVLDQPRREPARHADLRLLSRRRRRRSGSLVRSGIRR